MVRGNLKQKNEELTTHIKRIQAEFDNYRKREDANKKEHIESANKTLIEQIIPTLDTFDLAIKSTPEGNARQGMEMIYAQLLTILQDNGLKKLNPIDEEFNPELHEAIMIEHGEKDNIILEVIQPGYQIQDKIIRHAKVKISRRQTKNSNEIFESPSKIGGK